MFLLDGLLPNTCIDDFKGDEDFKGDDNYRFTGEWPSFSLLLSFLLEENSLFFPLFFFNDPFFGEGDPRFILFGEECLFSPNGLNPPLCCFSLLFKLREIHLRVLENPSPRSALFSYRP